MRRKLVVANRKMHGSIAENAHFITGLLAGTADAGDADYAVCLPHPYHFQAQTLLSDSPIGWGGQTMSRYAYGAHTGSVSASMLLELGCQYVIIGHSERRKAGYESDAASGERFQAATEAGLIPIFCMGETLEEFESGMTVDVIIRQLNAVLKQVGVHGLAKGIIAYEPIWAIGTGKAATPEHAQCILSFLRGHVELLNEEVADKIRILYGGSVNAKNAKQLFSMPDIDGGLVGGASLNTDEFIEICRIANSLSCSTISVEQI